MGSSEGVEMRTALAASQINALFGMPKVIYADFVCAANVASSAYEYKRCLLHSCHPFFPCRSPLSAAGANIGAQGSVGAVPDIVDLLVVDF